MPWALLIAIAFAPSTVAGQDTVPPGLVGQFGGRMRATFQGERYDASRNYFVVQVISGQSGEMVAKIGYYPDDEYACESHLTLEEANPFWNPPSMVLRTLDGDTCLESGIRVTFGEDLHWSGEEPKWRLAFSLGEYSVDMVLTRKLD